MYQNRYIIARGKWASIAFFLLCGPFKEHGFAAADIRAEFNRPSCGGRQPQFRHDRILDHLRSPSWRLPKPNRCEIGELFGEPMSLARLISFVRYSNRELTLLKTSSTM